MTEVDEKPQNEENQNNSNDVEDPESKKLLTEKIVTQVEYYFGDFNLPRDKFLLEETKKDDGWVTIETLLSFKRLATLSSDPKVIAEAVSTSSIVEVNEEKNKIRRKPDLSVPEMNEEYRKELMKRTVYCKGFPLENTTVDDILPFFKKYGNVESVILRHYQNRATNTRGFKGSVFAFFKTVEDADAFLKLDEVKYNDTVLVRKWQSDYIDQKRKERIEEKLNRQSRKRDHKGKQKGEAEDGDTEKKEEKDDSLPLGAVVHVTGISEGIQREDMKEAVEKLGFPVAYVDFIRGDSGGWIRLEHANTAKELFEKIEKEENGKLTVNDTALEVRVLEGEEEANFLEKVKQEMLKRRSQGGRRGRRNRGGRGGGHFNKGNRKRRGSPGVEAPPPKVKAE